MFDCHWQLGVLGVLETDIALEMGAPEVADLHNGGAKRSGGSCAQCASCWRPYAGQLVFSHCMSGSPGCSTSRELRGDEHRGRGTHENTVERGDVRSQATGAAFELASSLALNAATVC